MFSEDDDICAFLERLCDRYELLREPKKNFERKLDTMVSRSRDLVMKGLYSGRFAQMVDAQASMPDQRIMFVSASVDI